jgi:hypothetical protein
MTDKINITTPEKVSLGRVLQTLHINEAHHLHSTLKERNPNSNILRKKVQSHFKDSKMDEQENTTDTSIPSSSSSPSPSPPPPPPLSNDKESIDVHW